MADKRIQCFLLEPTDQTVQQVYDTSQGKATATRTLWRRSDNGELLMLHDAPPGAMYFATWLEKYDQIQKGPDGHVLIVITPKGPWNVDSRASNCTRLDDNKHRCWLRHGTPPLVTVDKLNGDTCSAGAGSFLRDGYHCHLTDGCLVEC